MSTFEPLPTTKIVLFDIDGTLLITSGTGAIALEDALSSRFGISGALKGIPVAGRTDFAILRDVFDRKLGRLPKPDELEEASDLYFKALERQFRNPRGLTLLPGIPTLVQELAKRSDVVLGLGTGNMERTGRLKLQAAGLDEFFATGGFAEDAGEHGERSLLLLAAARRATEDWNRNQSAKFESTAPLTPPPPCVLIIGDTILDVQAARKAGFRSLAVATGPATPHELRNAGADFVLEDLASIPDVLDIVDKLETLSPPRLWGLDRPPSEGETYR